MVLLVVGGRFDGQRLAEPPAGELLRILASELIDVTTDRGWAAFGVSMLPTYVIETYRVERVGGERVLALFEHRGGLSERQARAIWNEEQA